MLDDFILGSFIIFILLISLILIGFKKTSKKKIKLFEKNSLKDKLITLIDKKSSGQKIDLTNLAKLLNSSETKIKPVLRELIKAGKIKRVGKNKFKIV